jgi:hypothetical protein
MIYPKGEAVYQNLSTEYTDLPQLLSALKPKGFSGIVEIVMAGKKGAFFMVSGEVVNAASGVETDPPAIIGEDAVEKLLTLSTRPDGVVNVYQVPSMEVEFAAGSLVRPESLFKDLSTDFVRLDQFIRKLQDEKLTGYIEIFARKNRRVGKLFLKDGKTIGLQITPESGVPSFFERETVPPLLEEFVKQGATFSVYRSKGFAIPMRGTNRGTTEAKRGTTETKRETAEIKEHKSESLNEPNVKEEQIFEIKLEEKPIPAKDPEVAEKQKVESGAVNGRNEFLTAIQRIFLKMEKFMDSFSEKGGFQRVFKKVCIERSETHHFLDPFEGLFDYQGKKIYLDAGVGTEEFITAIAECLNLTLSYIKKDFPKNATLPPGLKEDIESAFRKHQDIISVSGF